MPGAKLIAQTRAPGDASIVSRWRSCSGCSAIAIKPLPQTGSSPAPSSPARSAPPALGDHVGAAGLVLDLDPVASRPRLPALGGRSSREDLLARRGDERAGSVGRPQRLHRRAAARTRQIVASQHLLDRLLGRLVLALAEMRPRECAAASPRGTATATPCSRSRARSRSSRRARPDARRPGRRRLPTATSRSPLNRNRGEWTPSTESPSCAVAAVPLEHVGQRPDAVQLREVEEMDEHRAGRRELAHPRRLVAVQPHDPARELGRGDVVAARSHALRLSVRPEAVGILAVPCEAESEGRSRAPPLLRRLVKAPRRKDLKTTIWERIESSRRAGTCSSTPSTSAGPTAS